MIYNFLMATENLIIKADFEHGFQWMGDLHSTQPSGRMKTNRPDGVSYGYRLGKWSDAPKPSCLDK